MQVTSINSMQTDRQNFGMALKNIDKETTPNLIRKFLSYSDEVGDFASEFKEVQTHRKKDRFTNVRLTQHNDGGWNFEVQDQEGKVLRTFCEADFRLASDKSQLIQALEAADGWTANYEKVAAQISPLEKLGDNTFNLRDFLAGIFKKIFPSKKHS